MNDDFILVLGCTSYDSKVSTGKSNIGYPKANSGCPVSTASRTTAECMKNTFEPPLHHTEMVLIHTTGFNATYF